MATRTVIVAPSGGDYTSLQAAMAAENDTYPDLTTNNGTGVPGILEFKIQGDWTSSPDTTTVDIDGYTTSATCYIKIYTDSSNRAGPTWSTAKYILQVTDGYLVQLRADYIWIDGLQFKHVLTSGAGTFYANITRSTGWVKISNSVLRGNNSAYRERVSGVSSGALNDLTMWNCIFYDWGSHAETFVGTDDAGTVMTAYNCTIISNSSASFGMREDGGSLVCKNCYSGGSGSDDYYGSIALTTCASSDTTGDIDSIAINTTNFTNVTAGSENWALPSSSGLIGVGTDSVYADAATDINGDTRTSTWDIGADEYLSGYAGSFDCRIIGSTPVLMLKGIAT